MTSWVRQTNWGWVRPPERVAAFLESLGVGEPPKIAMTPALEDRYLRMCVDRQGDYPKPVRGRVCTNANDVLAHCSSREAAKATFPTDWPTCSVAESGGDRGYFAGDGAGVIASEQVVGGPS